MNPFKSKWKRRKPIAPHTRHLIWESIFEFVKKLWKHLLVLMLLPLLADIPVWFLFKGNLKWFYLGVLTSTGPWLTVLVVILWSDVSKKIMGLEHELFTAETLEKLNKQGWQIINGARLRGTGDIDHIAIGPGGILVIETKWSSYKWISQREFLKENPNSTWLRNAINQVVRNQSAVKEVSSIPFDYIPIKSVCVLWSSDNSTSESDSYEYNDVSIVLGANFESWIDSLSDDILSKKTIDSIYTKIIDADIKYKTDNPSKDRYGNLTISRLFNYLILLLLSAIFFLLIVILLIRWIS